MSLLLNVNDTFGAYTLGTFASSILFGVTCFQTHHYFNTYSDGPLLKLLVTTVTSFAALHVGFSIHAVYHYLITDYFSPLSLLHNIWFVHSLPAWPFYDTLTQTNITDCVAQQILFGVIAIVVLLVQLFYAMRIYIIGKKSLIIPTAVTIAALTHLATSWILVAVLFNLKSLLDLPGLPETLAKVSLSMAVAIDITIATTLSYYLHTSRTGIKQTDRLINRLMKYTINNGILTTVFDIITLTLVITRPKDLIFLAFSQVLASLYTNSFLATLNARKGSTNEAVVAESYSMPTSIHFGTVVLNGPRENTTSGSSNSDVVDSSPTSKNEPGRGPTVRYDAV